MQALPGVAPLGFNPHSGQTSPASVTLVPAAADQIPQEVLTKPVIGEAYRFDGPTAPAGWILAKGQDLSIADNPKLFAVLGHPAGDRSTTTFRMPNPGFGYVVAAAGTFMTGPQIVAAAARHLTSRQYSLGPNAIASGPRMLTAKQQARQQKQLAALRESQQLANAAPRAAHVSPTPIAPDRQARIDRAQDAARGSVLAALSPENRARFDALVASAVAGSTTVYRVSLEMSRALSSGEARALLAVHDATEAELRPGWAGMDHPDPQLEAARYLLSAGIDRDRARAISTMS